MICRIYIIKMLILPKCLNLFQTIPLPPPETLYCTMRKIFTRLHLFLCWSRTLLCPTSVLDCDPLFSAYHTIVGGGGLKMPNLKLYNWAAQLRATMCYFYTNDVPAWKELENDSSHYTYIFILHKQKNIYIINFLKTRH